MSSRYTYLIQFSHLKILVLQIDLGGLYNKAGLKNVGIMFLMTDSQIPDEKFLVLINDMLSSGEIPDLLADDEIDTIVNGVAPEVIKNYINIKKKETGNAVGDYECLC